MTYEEARAQFPVLEQFAYLQAGSVGPLGRRTIEAMRESEELGLRHGRGVPCNSSASSRYEESSAPTSRLSSESTSRPSR